MLTLRRYGAHHTDDDLSLFNFKRLSLAVLGIFAILATISQFFIRHKLSIDLGGGDCRWTEAKPLPADSDPHGTLVASYPGSGMRITWQQIEGLTGIKVGDDFKFSGPRVGIIKTQWPHYQGIWSFGSTLDQVILVVRNPRWAIPSYHNILSEVDYAQDWNSAFEHIDDLYTKRAPLGAWVKWRDLKFDEELDLWALHIDYYMEDGPQYWDELDYERVGQRPFHFRTDDMKPWPKDTHCIYDIDCVPKEIISYEKLRNYESGPEELRKVANAFRGEKAMTVLSNEAVDCVWFETFLHADAPQNDDRDDTSFERTYYGFTNDQTQKILDKLQYMKDKYSQGQYANMTVATTLVTIFDEYIEELEEEVANLQLNPAPTPVPDPQYHEDLVSWYADLAGGERYNISKVQKMRGYWPLVKHLYDTGEQ